MSETLEELNECASTLIPNTSYFYAKADEHFTTLQEIQFDRVTSDFYGCARLKFSVLKGFRTGGNSTLKKDNSLYIREVENNLFSSYDEAVKYLYNSLTKIFVPIQIRDFQKKELQKIVDLRFGETIANYQFTKLPEYLIRD